MLRLVTMIVFVFTGIQINAQLHDKNWISSYVNAPPEALLGKRTLHSFENDGLSLSNIESNMSFYLGGAYLSDIEGNLIFYTNGIELKNGSHETVPNSEGFNYHNYHDFYNDIGLPSVQAAIFLPDDNEDIYHLLHTKVFLDEIGDSLTAFSDGVYYTKLSKSGNGGAGEVLVKGEPIFLDTLWLGTMTSVKHANGRDWWILKPSYFDNTFHRILLKNGEVEYIGAQSLGYDFEMGLAQLKFSPNGNKMSMTSAGDYVGYQNKIYLYDFDRCTGLLSNPDTINMGNEDFAFGNGLGLEFSPNNRYMYYSFNRRLYQFDLLANNVSSSRVLIDTMTNASLLTMFLGIDGKIYIAEQGGVSYLSVIHNPNGLSDNVNFVERGLELPKLNASTSPNFPNYRLGPMDGSTCDTLGIDNTPLANFNYYLVDSMDDKTIGFVDHSAYEPTDWYWTVEDNGVTYTGQEFHHTFSDYGSYTVCVTASNGNGSDTNCKQIEISPITSVKSILPNALLFVEIHPNPVIGGQRIEVYIRGSADESLQLSLFSMSGQLLSKKTKQSQNGQK